MIEFKPRKFKFKAWNKEAKLLLKLSSIECVKGELNKKDHLLLQFTGLTDKNGEELYEMDIVLIQSEKFVVLWNTETNGWFLINLRSEKRTDALSMDLAAQTIRLCSYFESADTNAPKQ